MKASELRIGNLINNGISDVEISAKHILGINNRDYETVRPILITNEWLVKFGFEKKNIINENHYKINSDLTYIIDYNFLTFRGYILKDHIKHVHQLQNLYFALTGEELEIK